MPLTKDLAELLSHHRAEADRLRALDLNDTSTWRCQAARADGVQLAAALVEHALAKVIAEIDPGLKEMHPARVVEGTQEQWATKEDHNRFGWNACRAEMLNRLKAALSAQSKT